MTHRTLDPLLEEIAPALAVPTDGELAEVDAWWRARNYLTIGEIYLEDNPLLRRPLTIVVTAGEDKQIAREVTALHC